MQAKHAAPDRVSVAPERDPAIARGKRLLRWWPRGGNRRHEECHERQRDNKPGHDHSVVPLG